MARKDGIKIYFEPIPPDTTESLKQSLLKLGPRFAKCFDRCMMMSEWLTMYLPDNEEARQFIKQAKRICKVHYPRKP